MNTRILDILRTILIAVTVTYCCAIVPQEHHIPAAAMMPIAPIAPCDAAPDGSWQDAEIVVTSVTLDVQGGPMFVQVLDYPCTVELSGPNDAVLVKTVYDPAEYEWILQSIASQNDIL